MSPLLWRNIKWSEDAGGEGFPQGFLWASVLIIQIHEHSDCRGHRATSECKVTTGWIGTGWQRGAFLGSLAETWPGRAYIGMLVPHQAA